MGWPKESRASRRAVLVGRIAFVWAALVLVRLVYLQIVKHDELLKLARNQQQHLVSIRSDRGEILDRTGQPLAVSVRTLSAVVNPQRIPDSDFFAGNVAPILGLEPRALARRIRELQEHKRRRDALKRDGRLEELRADVHEPSLEQLFLKRHISPEERARLEQLPFKFVEFVRDSRRIYPNDDLAVHVVGGIDQEGNGNVGIEARLNQELKGRDGKMRVLTDSRQDTYYSWVVDPGEQGANVTLTVHRVIQHSAEVELVQAMRESGAWAGSVVVMDPQSGEVLAMANSPTFDRGREIKTEDDLKRRINIAVQAPCEPGSVMKMITVAMGLESGRFSPETPIYCENGVFPRPGRRAIHDVHHYGMLDVAGVLIKSSNIGVTKISLAMGPDRLAEYLEKFQIGHRTNVGLPGESRGMLAPRDEWAAASHEYMSFGHEVSATAIQLTRAVAVIANGGLLIQPHVVLKKERPSIKGSVEETLPLSWDAPKRVLRPEVTFTMRRIMQRVVLEGTGKAAKIPGYSSGGKTGSAEIFDQKLKRWVDRHNSSFIGFAPVVNPRIVVVVTLNGSVKLGGASAAPVFSKVAETALRVLQVPKDEPEDSATPEAPKPEPPSFDRLAKNMPPPEPETEPEDSGNELVGPRVPDFRGLPVAAALREALELGLPVSVVGGGTARGQRPLPGTILPAGKVVRIEFRR
jgi:cell division protein FtsI (penicillin-binding protein 3)